jgi:prevent-host-death family protein
MGTLIDSIRFDSPSMRRHANLVSMTIFSSTFSLRAEERAPESWRLQDAKARFSEVVRLAHQAGPQRVTVHGRQAVVVVDAAEFDRLQGDQTGRALIEALQASPHRDVEIEPARSIPMPVRAVEL